MADTQTEGLSREELLSLINEHALKAMSPAIEKALAPLAQTQKDFAHEMLEHTRKSKEAEATLGKYPIGRKALAIALANLEGVSLKDADGIAAVAKKHWAPSFADGIAKWCQHVKTTLTAGTATTAGDMVIPAYDPEWIELLRNNAVVRGLARTIPMPRGAVSRRKQTGAATASYQGELGPITPSNQTVGRVNLSYKKLTAATVVSNDLIRFAGGEVDRLVQEDLLRVSALREDRAFLVGNPPTDAGSPQGIRYQTLGSNITASAGTSLANFQSDLTALVRSVQANNVMATPANSGFVMSVSTFWTIYALTTTTGDWVFAPNLAAGQPRLLGFPVYLTTQLEVSNSFIGANSGLIFFAHWPSMEIHDSLSRTVEAFRGGAYRDDTGTIQSGISNDETVITSIAEHDFLQVYDVAAAIKTGYAT